VLAMAASALLPRRTVVKLAELVGRTAGTAVGVLRLGGEAAAMFSRDNGLGRHHGEVSRALEELDVVRRDLEGVRRTMRSPLAASATAVAAATSGGAADAGEARGAARGAAASLRGTGGATYALSAVREADRGATPPTGRATAAAAGFQPLSAVELGLIPRREVGAASGGAGTEVGTAGEGRVRGVAALEAMPSGADILCDAILEETILLQQEREVARMLGAVGRPPPGQRGGGGQGVRSAAPETDREARGDDKEKGGPN